MPSTARKTTATSRRTPVVRTAPTTARKVAAPKTKAKQAQGELLAKPAPSKSVGLKPVTVKTRARTLDKISQIDALLREIDNPPAKPAPAKARSGAGMRTDWKVGSGKSASAKPKAPSLSPRTKALLASPGTGKTATAKPQAKAPGKTARVASKSAAPQAAVVIKSAKPGGQSSVIDAEILRRSARSKPPLLTAETVPFPELDPALVATVDNFIRLKYDARRAPRVTVLLLSMIITLEKLAHPFPTRERIAKAFDCTKFGVDAALSIAGARELVALKVKIHKSRAPSRGGSVKQRYYLPTEKLKTLLGRSGSVAA